jgi:hypothetical protein
MTRQQLLKPCVSPDPTTGKISLNVMPRFVVFHKPPNADTTYQVLGFLASIAMSTTRPVTSVGPMFRTFRLAKNIGVQPIGARRRLAGVNGRGQRHDGGDEHNMHAFHENSSCFAARAAAFGGNDTPTVAVAGGAAVVGGRGS